MARVEAVGATLDATVTYHDSCSCLREAGVRDQPRILLASVAGLTLTEAADREVCCGFGGAFAVKYPTVSAAMARDKADRLEETGAAVALAADMGCLLNVAGVLARRGSDMEVRHVAEALAGDTSTPAIGRGGS